MNKRCPCAFPITVSESNIKVFAKNYGELFSSIYNSKVLKGRFIDDKYVLVQDDISEPNTKYIIRQILDLNGATITVPENCIIEFDGGTVINGTIVGQDTFINNVGGIETLFDNVTKEGTWRDAVVFSSVEKEKLAAIEEGAEVNVQSDWAENNTSSDAYIKNKPAVYTKTEVDNKLSTKQDTISDLDDIRSKADTAYQKPTGGISDEDMASDVKASLNKADTALQSVSKSDVGLDKVTNDAQVKRTEMGANNGVATLDSNGKVPSSQLPSYVDDVIEYNSRSAFPSTGESGKLYLAKDTGKIYRWSGSTYAEISSSLALGETTGTAYDGGKGKALADKLATIEEGAQVHKAPTASEVKTALGTGSGTTKFLREDGTWATPPQSPGGSTITINGKTTDITISDVSTDLEANNYFPKATLKNFRKIDIKDTSGNGISQGFNAGITYYLTSTSTGENVSNRLTLNSTAATVGYGVDIYMCKDVSDAEYHNVPLVIDKGNQSIIRMDTGVEADTEFLTLNAGDLIHMRVLAASKLLAYKFNVSTSPQPSEDRTKITKYSYADLRSGFNTVLNQLGESGITGDIDTYLQAMYNAADAEWDNLNSDLFKVSTYPEVYSGDDYRGTDISKQELTYKAMQLWLAAMCLSELIPSSGTTSNNQTALFDHAYDESQGTTTPLYGGYAIDADPMIGRLAAGAVYAKNHDAKASDITSARTVFGGSLINASDWSGLGYTHAPDGEGSTTSETYKLPMTACGYLVNTLDFLQGPFGPFASSSVPSGFPYGQPSDQYIDSDSDFWKVKNYKVDINIDAHITQTYIAYTPSGNSYIFKTPANANEKEINQRLIESGFIPSSTDFVYFGSKRLKYVNTLDVTIEGNSVSLHRFIETSDAVSNTNNVYDYVGPFASLMSVMFSGSNTRTTTNTIDEISVSQTSTVYNRTSHMIFLEKVMKISDNSRYPTISNYKRKRPNGGQYTNQNRVATQQDTLGGFECGSLSALSATDDEYTKGLFAKWGSGSAQDDYPGDSYGNSYPSGHSAQAWTLAMYLGQMKPSSIAEFMTNAYRFTVNRSVAKFHWNSDLIYGRLFATMIIPIINAMSGLSSGYTSVKNAINGTSTGVSVNIRNNTESTITLRNKIRFVLANGSTVVSDIIALSSDSTSTVNIAAGDTLALSGLSLGDLSDYIGYNFATDAQVTEYNTAHSKDYLGNIVAYDANDIATTIAMPKMATTFTLLDNATYNINIGGGTSSDNITVVIENKSGNTIQVCEKSAFRLSWDSDNPTPAMGPDIGKTSTTVVSIAPGAKHSFTAPVESQYVGKAFATSTELAAYLAYAQSQGWSVNEQELSRNVSIYDADGLAYTLLANSFPSSAVYNGGCTFNIVYGGSDASSVTGGGGSEGSAEVVPGSSPSPTPTTGNITANFQIINNSGKEVKSTGEISFYIESTTQEGYGHIGAQFKLPNFIAINQQPYTFPAGSTNTYTGEWRDDDVQTSIFNGRALTDEPIKFYDADLDGINHNSSYITATMSGPSTLNSGNTYVITITGYNRA